jgi:hypothetical protein
LSAAFDLHRQTVSDGVERTEAVIGMALRGNPATDAAVACMIGNARSGRRVGPMTNCHAALHGVEFALDLSLGRPLTIITCNTYASPTQSLSHDYAGTANRIRSKMGLSRLLFRKKAQDRRFDFVNTFARLVLDSRDPLWVPREEDTLSALAQRVEQEADDRIESPAESKIYESLKLRFSEPVPFEIDPKNSPGYLVPAFRGPLGVLVPQFKIGFYRADFGVVGHMTKLAIEVDGYTYHSSREAFANDRKRERELVMMGWQILRYTGSEALYEPERCAQQVIDFLEGSL